MSSPEFTEDPQQRAEWRRQELALQAERHTARPAEVGRDGDVSRDLGKYRFIDRALREPRDELPEDFAAQTAAFVESASRSASDRLESRLQLALIVTLIVTAVVTLFVIGGRALAELAAVRGTEWIYTLALCFGLSLAIQHFTQRRTKKT